MIMNIRKMIILTIVIGFISLFASCAADTNGEVGEWYVNQQGGRDSNSGKSLKLAVRSIEVVLGNEALKPGDTIFIVGEYRNNSYGDGDIWKKENTIKINDLHGRSDAYITLKAYDSNSVLRGDGSSIIRITNSSYLKIEGFNVYGEVENISLKTALEEQFLYKDADGNIKRRVAKGLSNSEIAKLKLPKLTNIDRPSNTDTKGIYISSSEHISIINNHIHHMPGTGLRAAKSDYIDMIENEINDCSRRSYSGTHALVIHSSKSIDNNDGYKIRILRNRVHHNYNEIYSWSPKKTFITPHIDEGKGISLQKNSQENGWRHGRILVANNLAYWNGFSGFHNNQGERIDFINNTAYYNSYTGSITNKGNASGKNIGISTAGGRDIKIVNNIIVSDKRLTGFAISLADTKDLFISDNLLFGKEDPDLEAIQKNTILAAPKFVDAAGYNFRLRPGSPAIDKANAKFAPKPDYFGNDRDNKPDIGAIEFEP